MELWTYRVHPKSKSQAAPMNPRSILVMESSFSMSTTYCLSARGESMLSLTRPEIGAMSF